MPGTFDGIGGQFQLADPASEVNPEDDASGGSPEDDVGFTSNATTEDGFYRDFSEYLTSVSRNLGFVAPTEGVTKSLDLSSIKTAEDVHNQLSAAMGQQIERIGASVLDGINGDPRESYGQRRYDFLLESEGIRNRAYDDATGRPIQPGVAKKGLATIGVGFNMDRHGALDVWKTATGLGKDQFEAVKEGRRKLTDIEIRQIFDVTIQEAESFVRKRFKGTPLLEHERLALVSLAFNSPSLIGPITTKAIRAGDQKGILNQILNNMNRRKIRGLAHRRYREAQMWLGAVNDSKLLPDFNKYVAPFTK